jgi:putative exporter of polyketide antibiotics
MADSSAVTAGTDATATQYNNLRKDALASKKGITTASDGATVTFNLDEASVQTVVLAGNRTLALSNVQVGQIFCLRLVQDTTGSRTVTWFTTIKWPYNVVPTLTTTANKTDVFVFICTGSGTYDGFTVGMNL